MSTEPLYHASYIKATVTVECHRRDDDLQAELLHGTKYLRRTVEMSFDERFMDNGELDAALDAFTRTIKEAARR